MNESPEVITIAAGFVNCYLLRSGERFVLVDTGMRTQRSLVEKAIADAGCSAGKLALIVVTHGDADHIGNCAYLRDRLGGEIGMHRLEAPTAEKGDRSESRPHMSGLSGVLFAAIGALFGPRKTDLFTPDVYFVDGDDLAGYGVDARVLELPGHTAGSIGVLTADGDLFCGDLMTNRSHPDARTLNDDDAQTLQSVERARRLDAVTVYPGHGRPFAMSEFAPPQDARR